MLNATVFSSSTPGYEYHHNKHYECEECGKHYVKLGQLYDHVRVTKHMCVHCLHCGLEVTTWKDRLSHFAHQKHALLDGPIFTAEVKNEPPNPQLLEPVPLKSDWGDSDDEDGKEEFPPGWWDDETDILVGIILSFRPNGTTTSKGLQKVLQLPYMSSMLQKIISMDGSLDAFLKRHKELFQSEPMYKLRLKVPREDCITALMLQPRPAFNAGKGGTQSHFDQRWSQPSGGGQFIKQGNWRGPRREPQAARNPEWAAAAAAATGIPAWPRPTFMGAPAMGAPAELAGPGKFAAASCNDLFDGARMAASCNNLFDTRGQRAPLSHPFAPPQRLPALGEVPRLVSMASSPALLDVHVGLGAPQFSAPAGHAGASLRPGSSHFARADALRPPPKPVASPALVPVVGTVPESTPAQSSRAAEFSRSAPLATGPKKEARSLLAAKVEPWALGGPAAPTDGERDTWLPKFLELWQQLVKDDAK